MKKILGSILICLQLAGVIGVTYPVSAKETSETIRVGYSQESDFIHKQKGEICGFVVDYLELIAQDTGWEYEYVPVERSESKEKLADGTVDIMFVSQNMKYWQDEFLYSKASLGYEYFLVYTMPETDVYYDDYQAMDGLTVGIPSGLYLGEELNYLMRDEDFTLKQVEFDSRDKMKTALEEGEIDLFITSSYDSHADLKLVARFGSDAIYCITSKQNQSLISQFDTELEEVKIQKPDTAAVLLEKYFKSTSVSCGPLYTREEQEYIENADPVKISMRLRSHPLSYAAGSGYGGIYVDYLELLSKRSGLKFEIIFDKQNLPIEQRMLKMLKEDCMVLLPGSVVKEHGLKKVIMSDTLLDSRLSYVKRKSEVEIVGRQDYVFALTKDMDYLLPLIQEASNDYRFLFFESTQACLDAVYDGVADIAMQDNYAVRYLLQKPKYAEKLVECSGEEYAMDLCLVATDDQKLLVQILNKAIERMTNDDEKKVVTRELSVNPYQINIGDWLYKYRRVLIFTVVIIAVAAAIYTILLRKMTAMSVRKKDYDALKTKVQQDIVTGAYNRNSFYEKAKEMISNSDEPMCIVMADISNFKVVNDLYGMDVGDKMLKHMAKKFLALGDGRDMLIARFAGDHFYMCMSERDFNEIAFPKRFKTFLQDMEITVSYGVFMVGDQKDLPINIMCDRASIAVHGKENNVEYIRYYSDDERSKILQQQEIENDMEKALEQHQFCVYVQPKYDIDESRIVGGEALVRWKHPQKGMISPGIFIEIFEKNGFIIRLDYYVWEETCRLLAKLKKEGITGYPISINVSRAHFFGTDLVGKLKELIEKYKLEPGDLELEITESICGQDQSVIYKKIRTLQKAGFKVAMDDFGSGYSSLNMLKEMPLDIIKMDLKFLDGGEDEERSRNILYTLISLAQNLQLFVVVEGVETEDQVEFLRQIGNHYVQGFFFSRPVESATYEEMLKNAEA